MIKDNLNPVFKKTVQVFYQFEINQNVRFEVIDDDEHGKFEIIGRSEIMMAQLVGSKQFTYTADLFKPDTKTSRGKITVKVAPLKATD